jgi:hypothetical protein
MPRRLRIPAATNRIALRFRNWHSSLSTVLELLLALKSP